VIAFGALQVLVVGVNVVAAFVTSEPIYYGVAAAFGISAIWTFVVAGKLD
jgi:hypothetical protein